MDCLSSEDLKEERRKLTHLLRYADRIGLSTRWLATISGEKGKLEGWTNSLGRSGEQSCVGVQDWSKPHKSAN